VAGSHISWVAFLRQFCDNRVLQRKGSRVSETQPRAALAIDRQKFGDSEEPVDARGDMTSDRVDRPRPLEFDRNGFPVVQRPPDFVTRVARLRGS
jgi:hypothetical protein